MTCEYQSYLDQFPSAYVYFSMGWSKVFAFMPYGERWKEQRKMFTREFTPAATLRYHLQETAATNTMLSRLVGAPDEWHEHLKMSVRSS